MTNQLNTSPEFYTVDINNFRRDLTKLLKQVKAGETFIITERGKPIASVKPIVQSTLQELIDAGIVTPATRKYDPRIDKPVPNPKGIDCLEKF